MAKKIYYISGLGASEKAFGKLDFVQNKETTYLPWITPEAKESMEDYAGRMAAIISDEDENILIGLSFGGMLASEIAKIKSIKKVIYISSCKCAAEVPSYFKLMAQMGLVNLLPAQIIKATKPVLYKFLGCLSDEERTMADEFINKVDPHYLKWSMQAICHWKNEIIPNNHFHIHGTKDLLLPSSFVKADTLIQNGNHFMIMNKAQEVNQLINEALVQN